MNGNSTASFNHSHSSSSSRDENACNRDGNAFTDADEFPRAVAKTAVAQICEAAGFHSVQFSALETLADIAIRYLCDTGKTSQFYANLAGRTQSNALDVLSAVEDVNGRGLADVQGCIASSDTPSELKRFVDYSEEIPFCKPVPHFPIRKKQALTPSFSQLGEKPPNGHIPPWLPAFPDEHTYKATPIWNERKVDPRIDKLEQAKQRRKAEHSLVSLHLRLCSSGASSSAETTRDMDGQEELIPLGFPRSEPLYASKLELNGLSEKQKVDDKGPSTSTQNPFLRPPLPPDAKEVSLLTFNGSTPLLSPAPNAKKIDGPVALPSALEAFTPALEAATLNVQETSGAFTALGGFLPPSKKRMPLLMTFDFGRRASEKAVAASLSLGGKGRKKGRPELKDDEKDEKKKRAEQILAQSLEGAEMVSNDRH
eukprot:c23876_g1_i2 orf=124-1401(+)